MKPLRFLFTIALLGCVGARPAVAEPPKELDQLRFEFQVELAELNQPLQKLSETYRSYLEKQKEAFQKAGQLEGMLMVDEELKTFEANPSPTLSKDPELQRLQEIYRKKRAEMEDGEGGLSAPQSGPDPEIREKSQ